MTARRLLLLGPPGAGKGTQAHALAETLAVPQIATGEMFRAAVAAGTELGRELQETMERGDLVSDDIVMRVTRERLGQEDAQNGFILDGFPRTTGQAEALDALLEPMGCKLERCLLLVVEEEAVVRRVLRRAKLEKRRDDTEATVRKRLKVYHAQTEPLIEYYRERGILAEIDGMGSIDAVSAAIQGAIA